MNACTSSSNNEDRPPPSEQLFFDSCMDNVYDFVGQTTGYAADLTRRQRALLLKLSPFVLDNGTTLKQTRCIVEDRLRIIRAYCKELRRKRFARAYRRFSRVHAKKLDTMDEAQELLRLEMLDKDLNRDFYYASDEPQEYVRTRGDVVDEQSYHSIHDF